VPAVLMNPLQIVRGFTYLGAVAELGAGRTPVRAVPLVGWPDLRRMVVAQAPLLSAPQAGGGGQCVVCHGPSGAGRPRCFHCDLHLVCAGDALASAVVPVALAVKGGEHARRLWQYKSARLAAGVRARQAVMLRALLLVFLRDHAGCVWRAAGIAGPTHLAVVPTARGRPGVHPLRELIQAYLTLPWAELSAKPGGIQVRELDPDRFAAGPLRGATVLLVDDTWTTGSSAQSAAMALRRAGASSVVTVVLGRHVSRSDAAAAGIDPATMPFRPRSCAVHNDDDAIR
jgi:hypothetical protein